ncbi:glycine/sarcosine N-methyltransferase [Actinomycetospora sp. C-140]
MTAAADRSPDTAAGLDEYTEADVHQEFGENPNEVRDTNHYQEEYIKGFVDKWDDYIGWDDRAASEGSFFIDQLSARGVEKVLDVATGTGFNSLQLLKAGFETVSADGSAEMLAKAFENGRQHGHVLRVVQADWRWLNRDVHGEYDAIICLGNSFTHLFNERDRRKALAEFYAMLKHDGVLILDQRNYDEILDHGFSSKHKYFYCGDTVTAEPEYIDDGLARFRYTFHDDGSVYHLNMFPLRKDYVRRLMREVGFQKVDTYGDFQETYGDETPDFWIHVAEKTYRPDDELTESYSAAVHTARDYYNSTDADTFYHEVWGGEDIHVGLYDSPDEAIAPASQRTVERMAQDLGITDKTRILDMGAGYGGSARWLAKTFGCHVTCLNLSEVENERNREKNRARGLDHLVDVVDGSFESMPVQDNYYDLVWSQDAFLHSGERRQVIAEIERVLTPKGQVVFTDPMADDNADTSALSPILARLHLDTLGSPGFYREEFSKHGFNDFSFEDHTQQLTTHYGRVLAELEAAEPKFKGTISDEYVSNMKTGLKNWVNGGKSGQLAWGIFRIRR